jgi:hypothetical protein
MIKSKYNLVKGVSNGHIQGVFKQKVNRMSGFPQPYRRDAGMLPSESGLPCLFRCLHVGRTILETVL